MDYRYWKEPESDSLMHYGVLGMRWGVRKANKEIKRVGKDLKYLVKKTAVNTYGSRKDERAKRYISKQNAIIDSAVAIRKQKAKEALAANRGKKDVKANFVVKNEEQRNRMLMPKSYAKRDEAMSKSSLSLSGLLMGAALGNPAIGLIGIPALHAVSGANSAQASINLDDEIKKMSIFDVSKKVNTYLAGVSDHITPKNASAIDITRMDSAKPPVKRRR